MTFNEAQHRSKQSFLRAERMSLELPETEESCPNCECFPSKPEGNCDCDCHTNYEPDGIDMAKENKYGYY